MMRPTLFKRTAQFVTRRQASTSTNEAAQKAQQAASKAQEQAAVAAQKGLEGLKMAGNAAAGMLAAVSKMGGPAAKVAKKIESLIPPTVYYSKVGLEMGKIVFRARSMAPPSLETMQATWKQIYAQSKTFELNHAVQWAQSLTKKDAAAVGVVVAEVIGFFTVGEIIGKRKLVGYRGKVEHAH